MSSTLRLTLAQARRIALAAQGFGGPRAGGPVTMRQVQAVITRVGQFQIDSVNVVARAHFFPLFSRLGSYDTAYLERAAYRSPRRLFEYWGHEASLLDVTLQPALRWRMAAAAEDAWGRMVRIRAEQPELVDLVRAEIAERGPLTARALQQVIEHDEVRSREHWGWNWSSVKTCLEYLFWAGEVSTSARNRQFERVYDIPARVLPPAVLGSPTPGPEEASVELVGRAARALGVASELALRDYFRIRPAPARAAIATLVAAGELLPVCVAGLENRPHYLWPEARRPRRIEGRALLSPFDSLIFERARVQQLFDFAYRIEIYVPEPARVYGYYVYPFLLDEALVARVDLKADRASGVLRVNAAWLEDRQDPARVAPELAAELVLLAGWQGLTTIEVRPRGDLAPALAAAV